MTDKPFFLYALCFILSFVLTVISERILIPYLKRAAKQPIYTEGPSWHISKSGTPTMGGLGFALAVAVALLLGAAYFNLNADSGSALSVVICILFALSNALIGIIDDLKKLKRRENAGLSPLQKLALQSVCAAAFLLARAHFFADTTTLSFSFFELELGYFYYPLAFILLLGIINCANLTDGVDGLASSVAFAASAALFFISFGMFKDASLISASALGACAGFLIFNLHPARIFMGDTGSLFLGALIAGVAFSLENPFVIILICGVYAIEGISVILQVISYKLTKKRIFKMAPLHHHLERSGWSENKICIVAILTTFLLSLLAFAIYMP
ncbi:MAG: phospho-N-acetylmuramoyl-pentapeptide-transferase [Clostridia bacterium]|nr:phospho-N-acetylmuramoyl-pentapeptide-transferase [Clostridia bacterium]